MRELHSLEKIVMSKLNLISALSIVCVLSLPAAAFASNGGAHQAGTTVVDTAAAAKNAASVQKSAKVQGDTSGTVKVAGCQR